MKNKKRISSTQYWVLDHMNNGWELGHSKGYSTSTWLQKGGIGRGGEAIRVSFSTLNALRDINAIEIAKESYPTDTYKLTDSAKELFK